MNPWFKFVNSDNGQKAEIYIYGYIVDVKWSPDDPEVTPQEFKAELDKLQAAKTLDIYMNSPGGNLFAGMSIYHMLKRHPANKIVHNDGVIASIASVISMAADKIIMPKTSLTLAHRPLIAGIFYGNADTFLKIAEDLEAAEIPIVQAYVQKTGIDEKKIKALLAEDRFMGAEEAVELGFADEFGDEKDIKATTNGKNIVVNGIELDERLANKFPKERVQAQKPIENIPQNVVSETVKSPDYSIIEAQIAINRSPL
jgi:ATP-dependent Clp protease protease subunit